MAAPSVTYTFTNGTTADATQVNTNFTDLISGLSDGTKDLTINNLSMNGNLTVGGAVTLGNASGDAITITGSIASNINVSANDTYDFGSATLAMRSFYLGSGTRSIRLIAGAVSGSYTLTLPPAAPTKTGMIMSFDTNATGTFRFANKLTANKTTTYTITSDETIVPCDTSGGAFTVTLPAASGNSGMVVTIKKVSTADFNAVTVDGDGSETIDGNANRKLIFPNESIKLVCNGTNWLVLERHTPKTIHAFTPTGSWVANTTYAGNLQHLGGNVVRFQYKISVSGAPTSATLTLNTPNSWNVDETTLLMGSDASNSELARFVAGGMIIDQSASIRHDAGARYEGTSTLFTVTQYFVSGSTIVNTLVNATSPFTFASGDDITLIVDIPIAELDQ